jgi:hypothetical protein
MASGMFLRVGIDSKSGQWNAPCRSDGRFCYVPIPDGGHSNRGAAFDRYYSEFEPFVKRLGAEWPSHLSDTCHLDPDFGHLTYGDVHNRGQRIRAFLSAGDFIVFWAGLRCLDNSEIVCSIIGFYTIAYIMNASEVGPLDAHRNAHTRYTLSEDNHEDVVVFGKPEKSGRLLKHVPIGRFRDGAQRVDRNLLAAWDNLQKADGGDWNDGYIHLSGAPPLFRDPDRFLKWFRTQRPKLVHANNV